MDYTIVGGQVNATSRLETAAAPDQILISHSTYSLVKDQIYCQPVGEISVKGLAHPIKTYEAISTREEYIRKSSVIEAAGEAFNLSVDVKALAEDERKAARDSLLKALEALNEGAE